MNRIALITGGSRGLGRSMALALAGKGIDVVITYHSQEAEAAKVVAAIEAQGRKGAALQLDVGDSKRFPAFVETLQATLIKRFGAQKLKILVNNAGTGLSAPFAQTTEEKFDQLVNEHLKAPYFLTQRLLPVLEDGARILNVSSGLARMTLPGSSAYGALKAADAAQAYKQLECLIKGVAFWPQVAMGQPRLTPAAQKKLAAASVDFFLSHYGT